MGCSREPKTAGDLAKAGDRAFAGGKYQEAKNFFIKGLAQSPSDRHLLYFAGLSYRNLNQYDSSILYFKKADYLYPNDRELNAQIYEVAQQTEDWKYVINAIKVLVAKGEPEAQYDEQLADLYMKTNAPQAVYYYQKRLLQQRPDDLDVYLRLIGVAAAIDSVPEAERLLATARQKFGESNPLRASQAMIFAMHKQFDKAEAIYRELVSADTANLGYVLGLANVLSNVEDREKKREALAIFEANRDRAPNPAAIDTVIAVLRKEL